MKLPVQLNLAPRLLLGPGPSDAHPRVLRAMTTPLLGHLDPQFLGIMNEIQDMLRPAFGTSNEMTFPVSATGMAGMEACLVNLLEPGETLLACAAGFFGQRIAEVGQRIGARVHALEQPWGKVFDPQQIRDTVKKVRPKVLSLVHAETSAGTCQPLEEVGQLCREMDVLLLVDTVTSLGCIPVRVDDWSIDATFSCSQKGLSCPPGLSPVTFSPRAVEAVKRRKTRCNSWYFDVALVQHYWDSERFYHHTAPISMIFALHEGLLLLHEEGLEARWERHRRNARALMAGLRALGLSYFADPQHQLPQIHVVRVPEGLQDLPVRRQLLNEFGIEIGGGLGDLKGRAWRIGLMGTNSRPDVVMQLLGALEACLLSQGAKVTPGAGVAAADRSLVEEVRQPGQPGQDPL